MESGVDDRRQSEHARAEPIHAISCTCDGPRRDTRPMVGPARVDGSGGGAGGGFVLLTIKNNSENTARMSGGNVIVLTLHEADIVDGNYTYEGTITAQEPGPFEIEASIEAHLAEAPPTSIAHGRGGPIAKGAPIGCCQYSNPASGNWCADETENECLGTWKGTNWKCNQNGRCGLNIPLGGGK